jgi:Second BRCT domain on Nijmegen syndrome breakage protein
VSKKHLERDLAAAEKKFRQLDIKISAKFEVSYTTHVVSAKRNVPAVLSGLISGCFIVSEGYVDAVVASATARSISSQTNPGISLASLEEDYYGNWPDPLQYVPNLSKEPVPRGPEFYYPKEERRNIFTGTIFIFCSEDQYVSLDPVIGLGGGKSFLWEDYKEGESLPEDLKAYIKHRAGRKPFVMVRLQLMEPNLKWKSDFVERSDALLGQRSAPQNEFLDSILTVDSTCLRQSLDMALETPAESGEFITLRTF